MQMGWISAAEVLVPSLSFPCDTSTTNRFKSTKQPRCLADRELHALRFSYCTKRDHRWNCVFTVFRRYGRRIEDFEELNTNHHASYSKKHQKRLSAPSHWLLDKMSGTYAPKASPGPHKLRDCLPLIVFIRNRYDPSNDYERNEENSRNRRTDRFIVSSTPLTAVRPRRS